MKLLFVAVVLSLGLAGCGWIDERTTVTLLPQGGRPVTYQVERWVSMNARQVRFRPVGSDEWLQYSGDYIIGDSK